MKAPPPLEPCSYEQFLARVGEVRAEEMADLARPLADHEVRFDPRYLRWLTSLPQPDYIKARGCSGVTLWILDKAVARFKANGAAGPGAAGLLPPVEGLDLDAFLDMTIPPRRFVLEPWLREKGLAMIHAKAGIGKTWFGMSCAYAISTGTAFLKWSAPAPLRVAYLDGEMAAEDTQDRLESICTKAPAPGYFRLVSFDLYDGPVPNIATPEGQERLSSVVDFADVIFVDNLCCLSFDEGRTDAESWETIQAWLLSLRRRGKSVVAIHHSGKSGAQRGTSRRADALDAIIKLERPADATGADGCRFTVTFEKARGQLGKAGEPFEAMLTDGVWTMKDEDMSMLMAVADLIIEGKSIRKIAAELGLDPTKVYRLKKQAAERGIL